MVLDKHLNCSGAALLIGRILEKTSFYVDHAMLYHHVANVVKLADGRAYYVDSRRPKDNIFALDGEAKQIGDCRYYDLNNPAMAQTKVIVWPRQRMDVEDILSNLSIMRREAASTDKPDESAQKQISGMGEINDIDFRLLASRLFPEIAGLNQNADWQMEEDQAEAKWDITKPLEESKRKIFGGLSSAEMNILASELMKKENAQKIYDFCSAPEADVSILSGLSEQAQNYAMLTGGVLRGVLADIKSQRAGGEEYEFVLTKLRTELGLENK